MFEGQFELVFPLALDELRVALGAVTLCEVDAVLSFGCGGLVTGSVRAGLDDVHYRAVFVRVAADIERVATHQYPQHRINAYVKFNFRHFFCSLIKRIKRNAMNSFHLPLYIVVISCCSLILFKARSKYL